MPRSIPLSGNRSFNNTASSRPTAANIATPIFNKAKLAKPTPTKVPVSGPKIDKRHKINAKTWIDTGSWVRVKSSNVLGIAYLASKSKLYVGFKGGKNRKESVYVYWGVTKDMARSIFNANSLGKWVWRRLRRAGVRYKRLS